MEEKLRILRIGLAMYSSMAFGATLDLMHKNATTSPVQQTQQS